MTQQTLDPRVVAHLASAQDARQRYHDTLQAAIASYGDRHHPTWREMLHGSPADGCDVCRNRGLNHTASERLNHQTDSVTAGIYSDHFPDPVKVQLRAYAHEISQQTSFALAIWRKTRRRLHTFRRVAVPFRVLRNGQESYY